MSRKKSNKIFFQTENKLNQNQSNLVGSIFSELKIHINKQSKFDNNTEIKKILEKTKNNEFFEVTQGNNLLFYIEESENGEFTNIPLIKEIIKNKDDKLSQPLIEENTNIVNYPTNHLSYKNDNKDLNVTYSLNKKIIIDDLVSNDPKINKEEPAPEGKQKSPRSSSVNFNIVFNSSNKNSYENKDEADTVTPKKDNITKYKTSDTIRNVESKAERINSVIGKKRIKKSKKSFNSSNNKKGKRDFQLLDNKGIKEFFTLLNKSVISSDSLSNKEVSDKNIVNFIKLYLMNMKNIEDQAFIKFIKNHEAFFNSLFQDLYLIINSFIIENWKWLDKSNTTYVSFQVFILVLTQVFKDEFSQEFLSRTNGKNYDNSYILAMLEKFREKMFTDSINKLKQKNNNIETMLKQDIENEKISSVNNEIKRYDTIEEYDKCIEKIQSKFLGYKYILKNLADL